MDEYVKSQITATIEEIRKQKGTLDGVTVITYGEEESNTPERKKKNTNRSSGAA